MTRSDHSGDGGAYMGWFFFGAALGEPGGNNTMKEMLLAQQQSSDQWAIYQAKVIREHQYRGLKLQLEAQLAEPSSLKVAERAKFEALATRFAEEEQRYNAEKKD